MDPSPPALKASTDIAHYLDNLADDDLAEILGDKIHRDIAILIDARTQHLYAEGYQAGLRDGALLPPQQD